MHQGDTQYGTVIGHHYVHVDECNSAASSSHSSACLSQNAADVESTQFLRKQACKRARQRPPVGIHIYASTPKLTKKEELLDTL